MRLAIITTHPIQYYAPVFVLLSKQKNIAVKVFYTWEKDAGKFDRDFGKTVEWDIPLLDGYDHCFVSNNNKRGKGFWDISNPGLVSEVESWGAEAVLIIGWNYRSHLRAMRYFKNKLPVLFRGDSTLLDEKIGLKTWLRRITLKYIYRHIDYALYVGEANRHYYLKHGLKPEQLIFAPHAIDNSRFATINNEHEDFIKLTKESSGIGTGCTTIVFCGKFTAKKNPLLLLEAFKTIDDQNLHLIIAGDGELEEDIKNAAKGFARIRILPFQNQSLMPAIYRLGEIFCLPSQGPGETWGLAVNEAMACGRAVLVSDKTGCAVDLVNEGINGYIFRSNDVEDLQAKIDLMIQDKEKLNQMGMASAELIKKWNFNAIAEAVKKIMLN